MRHGQLDLPSLASFDFWCRRMVQIETAVKRSPRNLNHTVLDCIMESPLVPSGTLIAT